MIRRVRWGALMVAALVGASMLSGPAATAASAERLSGADRYATAAAISLAAYPDPSAVEKVFVVEGTMFADGLGAGPAAAALEAPVVLTQPDVIPPATAKELRRLAPQEIVVVGGDGAVSSSVESTLRTYAAMVTRVSGADRYQTSRALARLAFPDGSDIVYLATGRDFPDALSGGALAARTDAPVILVDGRARDLSRATADLLRELEPARIVAIGGAGVLPQRIVDTAVAITGASAQRLGGADRYATSAKIAAHLPSIGQAIVATDRTFPDALVGTQLAARRGAPILLALPYCVPPATQTALGASSTRLTLLGGTGALRNLVGSRHACLGTRTATSPWVMVNKKNPLIPQSYAPSDLRNVGGTSQRMRAEAATALERMIAAARNEGAGRILPASGYRSYSTQKYLYDRAVARFGRAKAEIGTARPGHSEHQTGWTMDVVACGKSCGGIDAFGGTAQGRWTARNAHRFGFIVRYEPGYVGTTGYESEPWHLRYVGVTLATDYKASGFHTLEDYLAFPDARHY